MDLHVTLVRAAGGEPPRDRTIDGHDLTAMLTTGAVAPEREVFFFNGPALEAVRVGPWKLRHLRESPPELFHLEADPSERINRAPDEPAIVQRLEARLHAFESSLR